MSEGPSQTPAASQIRHSESPQRTQDPGPGGWGLSARALPTQLRGPTEKGITAASRAGSGEGSGPPDRSVDAAGMPFRSHTGRAGETSHVLVRHSTPPQSPRGRLWVGEWDDQDKILLKIAQIITKLL